MHCIVLVYRHIDDIINGKQEKRLIYNFIGNITKHQYNSVTQTQKFLWLLLVTYAAECCAREP